MVSYRPFFNYSKILYKIGKKKNVFELAYIELFKDHYNEIKKSSSDLFIDSTMIKNLYGKENIGMNHYDRNKNGTKITTIVDSIGVPVTIPFITPANINDVELIEPIIDKALIISKKSLSIIADKGYINEGIKHKLYNNHKIKLIYPYRKNQHKHNTMAKKEKLLKRHIVENFYSWLKKLKRIPNRMDSLSFTYYGFICIAYCFIFCAKYFNS